MRSIRSKRSNSNLPASWFSSIFLFILFLIFTYYFIFVLWETV